MTITITKGDVLNAAAGLLAKTATALANLAITVSTKINTQDSSQDECIDPAVPVRIVTLYTNGRGVEFNPYNKFEYLFGKAGHQDIYVNAVPPNPTERYRKVRVHIEHVCWEDGV